MAQTSNKNNKISEIAKNFKMKNKDILDVLEQKGISGKTHSAVLESGEMNVLLETLTKKHEASNEQMTAFWNRTKADAEAETAAAKAAKEAKKATKKSEESAEAKAETKAEVKTEVEKAKAEAKAEVRAEVEKAKTEAKIEAKAEIKAEVEKAKAEVKAESKVEAKSEAKAEEKPVPTPASKEIEHKETKSQFDKPHGGFRQDRGERTFDNRQNGERKPYSKDTQGTTGGFNSNRGDRPAYGEKREGGFRQDRGERTFDNRQNGERKPFSRDGQGATGGFNSNRGDRPAYGEKREGGSFGKPAQNNGPRFGNNSFDKPAFGQKSSDNKKPQNKNGFRPGGGMGGGKDDDYDSQSVRQPSIRPIYDKDGRARSLYKNENAEKTALNVGEDGSQTRLVDIRAREIDLSKYDDKFDILANESVTDADDADTKAKKPGNARGANGRINRNESAAREAAYANAGKFQKPAKQKGKKGKKGAENENIKKFTGPITLPEEIMISGLAAALRITTGEVIKKLLAMGLGMDQVGANKMVDFDTAYLLADEMGIVAEKEVVVTIEEKLFVEEEDKPEDLQERSPVVVVMGHVDHGKTSLLDAIRHTHVTSGEAGGITQHIGAYRVSLGEKEITFLDTPGHEAFTAMRARGAQATDIAILVVAADDGIMPQTVEAINHAKAAGVSIIVAINKMDKPAANPDAVKQALMNYELIPEEWGGDTICVPVSALKREGIDELLEMVTLVADMKELKANPNKAAKGIVIEARLDKGRGPVATVLVQEGTLHSGDIIIAGMATGRVRAMCDDRGNLVKEAGPSVPVEITGLAEVPDAGDQIRAVADERMARELVEKRKNEAKEEEFKANAKVSLEELFNQINEGAKELAVIIKADVQGSAEAVKASLEKLSNDEVKVRVIHCAVGGISEGDVMLADASNSIIIGFNVRPDKGAMDSAEMRKVDIRTYRVIYDCIEEITAALNGMLDPDYKEVVLGHAEVRQTIHVPGVGTIAGSYVQDGKIQRSAQIRVVRDGVVIFEDKISSLKRFKDDVKDVASGYECGIGLERFNDIKEGDVLEAFIMEEVKREIKAN